MDKLTTWEDFYEKKTYVYKTAPDWEKDPPGFRLFYEDPKANPLQTPTGLLEFYSEALASTSPTTRSGHPSRSGSRRASPTTSGSRANAPACSRCSSCPTTRAGARTPRATTSCWTRETPTGKVLGFDGYRYEPVWINPTDAAARGIKDGDVVKIFNERGIVLVGARVWERIMPGVIYVDHGARHDPIIPGKVDRGGAINTIAPNGLTSKNAAARPRAATWSTCSRVKNDEWEAWRSDHPEAFARDYDPAPGCASTPGSRKARNR